MKVGRGQLPREENQEFSTPTGLAPRQDLSKIGTQTRTKAVDPPYARNAEAGIRSRSSV
jgi:hypothetical protein